MSEPYYQRHAFFCVNRREDGRRCCADSDSDAMRAYAKSRMKAADFHGRGLVRVNSAGCLDRCDEGPVLVVYPDGVWYTFVDREDIDEIIDSHLLGGKIVDRLRI